MAKIDCFTIGFIFNLGISIALLVILGQYLETVVALPSWLLAFGTMSLFFTGTFFVLIIVAFFSFFIIPKG